MLLSISKWIVDLSKAYTTQDLTKDGAKFLIGTAAGWTLKVARDRLRTRKARAFWRPFLSKDLRIVVGRFREFKDFERSGFIGVGDTLALAELQRYLTRIGLREPQVVYADQIEGDDLKHPIISLGGPDNNAVTREVAKQIKSTLRFGNPEINEIAFRDTGVHPPQLYVPSAFDHDGSGTDYGLILRAHNPFAPANEVMVIAGSFGHGTWAGTRYVTSAEFLKLKELKKRVPIECFVETDVVRDTPQGIRMLIVRTIQD